MKIYFIRHGHPDYKNDCLTPLGHLQAEAAAERVKDFGIQTVYSSTRGRALQTAEHTANKIGLEVIPCEFMKEISWAAIDPEQPILLNGHPWDLAAYHANQDVDISDRDWREKEPYSKSRVIEKSDFCIKGLDLWLEALGYKRESVYYKITTDNTDKTVAMFSHGGASSVVFSHMFNIPFPQVCGAFHLDFTSITLVELNGNKGDLIYPKFVYVGDFEHIKGLDTENSRYDN